MLYFKIKGGEMQEIRVNLADHARWRGRIDALRVDPGSESDVDVAIEYIGIGQE